MFPWVWPLRLKYCFQNQLNLAEKHLEFYTLRNYVVLCSTVHIKYGAFFSKNAWQKRRFAHFSHFFFISFRIHPQPSRKALAFSHFSLIDMYGHDCITSFGTKYLRVTVGRKRKGKSFERRHCFSTILLKLKHERGPPEIVGGNPFDFFRSIKLP